MTACAAGKNTGVGGDDGGVTIDDAPIEIDAGPKNDFGEPCTDNDDCESGLCILVGTSGQCTQTCGDCPSGYGCVGVTGIQVEGQITFVCVPTSSQLCTTCTLDSECTLIGMDKCVTYPDGDRACARDCSAVGCPTGYDCETVDINGTDFKQCMASSGACDCTAANPGAMQPCNITTPWNVCVGAQTCGGASGWGSCQPPSMTDNPDATYTDDNCDGLDGDRAKAIFVAGGGANSATCGLTYMTPCQTISHGIIRAVTESRPHVYVQAGTYNEVVVMVNGIGVYGGYNFNWKRGGYSDPQHRVTINGGEDTGGNGELLAIRAHSLIVQATLADVVIKGPNASGTGGASGRDGKSSYAVHAVGAKLALTRVQILGGNGAAGGNGGNGADAVIVDRQSYMNGGTGGNGEEFTSTCNNSTRGAGGAAGTNTCSQSPSTRAMNGGGGGQGGTMDTNCNVFSLNLDARPGSNGSPAAFTSGTFGAAGAGGSGGGSCGPTTPGNPGLSVNGGAGGGNAGGYLSSNYWYARAGNAGGTGQNGSGGGGGGGGGGCDDGEDATGGGGGGGGAGGCAARGGGAGGGGGGGSIGILATGTSQLVIGDCELVRGAAGAGGNGGYGGRGQSGGLVGPGGLHPGSAAPGNGGAGAHGGHGGGGGGGAGGSSIGIVNTSDSTITGSCTQTGGSPGGGGSGGAHAPFAPALERDGNDGGNGTAGALTTQRTCTSVASC